LAPASGEALVGEKLCGFAFASLAFLVRVQLLGSVWSCTVGIG
jgi:hypothetical protein